MPADRPDTALNPHRGGDDPDVVFDPGAEFRPDDAQASSEAGDGSLPGAHPFDPWGDDGQPSGGHRVHPGISSAARELASRSGITERADDARSLISERVQRSRQRREAQTAKAVRAGHGAMNGVGWRIAAGAGIAFAVVTLAGAALGLPVPLVGENAAGVPQLDPTEGIVAPPQLLSGTATSVTKGPFNPVVGPVGYGESGAEFGASRSGRSHEGQDMFAAKGTPLVAVRDAVVVDGGPESGSYAGGRGNWIVIYNAKDERSYVYLHMLKPSRFKVGDEVQAGQVLGKMGCTGSCFGVHLHFEVRQGKASLGADTTVLDPYPIIKDWPQAPPLVP